MYFTHTSWRWNFCICGLDTSVCVNRLGWSPATTWLSPIPGDAIFNHRQSSSIITKPSVIFKEEDKETIIWNHLSFPFSSEPRYHSPSRSLQHNVLGVHMYVQHRDDGWHIITVTIINFRVTSHDSPSLAIFTPFPSFWLVEGSATAAFRFVSGFVVPILRIAVSSALLFLALAFSWWDHHKLSKQNFCNL